jgi:hypothetical protein
MDVVPGQIYRCRAEVVVAPRPAVARQRWILSLAGTLVCALRRRRPRSCIRGYVEPAIGIGLKNPAIVGKMPRGIGCRPDPVGRRTRQPAGPPNGAARVCGFAGSDRGGERAAVMLTLIQIAKPNNIGPQAWLADVLARINDHNIHPLNQLLPWNSEAQPARLASMSPARQNAASDSFNEIATVDIELRHTDPLIWRRVGVPTSITLKVLHDIIQAVIGWFDCHLWEFTIGKQRYGLPMDDDWGPAPRIDAGTGCACVMCLGRGRPSSTTPMTSVIAGSIGSP